MAQETLRIAAIVNDEIISVYDLSSRIKLVISSSRLSRTKETVDRLAPRILNNLVDEKIKSQEAKKLGVKISEREINKALKSIETRNKMPVGQLDKFLAQNQVDKSSLVDQVEAEIAWSKVIQRKFRSRLKISEEEIDEKIKEIEGDKGKPEFRVGEIFLPVDNPANEQEAARLSQRLVKQLREGGNFQALARNFSKSATASVGGDLGWVRLGQLGNELDQHLIKMKGNQLSPPIRTIDGFYILYLQGRRNAAGLVTSDVTVTLQQLFFPLAKEAPAAAVSNKIKLAAETAAKAGNCKDFEALGKQFASNLSGSLGKVNLNKLPSQLRTAVENLKANQTSQPLRTGDGVIVLMVCDRSETSAADAVRKSIRANLVQQRIDVSSRQYLRDVRRSAFVDIRL